jgi:hypothetical protein
VPGYEVQGVLGRGGMGVVYRARQVGLNRPVALKMILHAEHAAPEGHRRFLKEAESVARLRHPNIVPVYEVGEHQPAGGGPAVPFFSMELCEGGSLEDRLQRAPLTPAEAAALVRTLAQAVQHAHEQGIVHRDLKPANVLLTPDAQPKVTDFGLAKRVGEAGQTASGAVVGTPSYMAPEQAGGRGKEIDGRADVYALGALLYECLTGRPPFKAATAAETLVQVLADEPVPPRRLQPRVPPDLETVCLKCLHKEPKKRYQSAQELADDLKRFLAGEVVRARPVGRLERGGRWCKRNPAVAGLLAAVGMTLTLGAAAATGFAVRAEQRAEGERRAKESAQAEKQRAEEAERQAKREARAARMAEDKVRNEEKTARKAEEKARREEKAARAAEQLERRRNYWAGMLLTQAAWEQHRVDRFRQLLEEPRPRRVGDEDFRGFEWFYWQRQPQRGHLTLRAHRGPVFGVCFSPDGTRLASGGGVDRTVRVWDTATGKEVLVLSGHTSPVNGVCFSPDGKRLATSGGGTF